MTVPATTRRAGPFSGNGVTTSFPFTFKVFAATDVLVVKTAAGIEYEQTLNSDYSVTLNGDQDASPGGSITYPLSGSPLPAGQTLTVIGNIEYEQTLDIPGGGNFSPVAIENAFDRTIMQIQQLAEIVDRALTGAVGGGFDTALPEPEADTVIGWNSTADALINRDVADFATVAAFANWRTDVFNGTGAQTVFVLAGDPGNVNNMDVSISGVTQVNGVDFTVSGTTLTFTSAPPAGTGNVVARYGQSLPQGDGSFAQTGVGATTRTAQAKMRDVVSVIDYGAVPDASPSGFAGTDNSAAFQRAIDQAWLAKNSIGADDYGGGVYVPTGYYSFASGFKMRPGTYLYGDGVYASCLCAPATFVDTRGLVIMTDEGSPYNNVPGYATTIRDLGILGDNPPATSGIYIIKNGCVLDTLWISGFQNSGIVVAQTDILISNIFVEFCTYGITQVPLVWGLQVVNANIGNCGNGILINNNPRYTLQAGSSTTITMPTSFNSVTDSIKDYVVTIKTGAGTGGVRKITAYNGTTKVATLDSAWGIAPTTGDTITLEQGLGSNQLTNIRILPRSAAITPQATGIYVQGGRRTQITNVDVTQAREGDFTIGGIVIDQGEDVVITNYRTIASNDLRTPNTLDDALLITSSNQVTVNGMNASRWRRGIAIDNSTDVLVSGAQITECWLNGVAVSGGDRVVLNAVNSSDNNFTVFSPYAGGTAYVPGAIVSSSGNYFLCIANTTGNAPPNATYWLQVYPGGIADFNTAANAVHSITGCMANKGAAAAQVYGIVTNLTDNGGSTGRTIIGGGTVAVGNAVSNYLYLGRRDLTFTDQSYPAGGALQTVTAAGTITIPASAANNGSVIISGATAISTITAAGYAGASVTLLFTAAGQLTTGAGNLRLNGAVNFIASADDTITLTCNGTNWIETSRSLN